MRYTARKKAGLLADGNVIGDAICTCCCGCCSFCQILRGQDPKAWNWAKDFKCVAIIAENPTKFYGGGIL